jgi:hypothetical protein
MCRSIAPGKPFPNSPWKGPCTIADLAFLASVDDRPSRSARAPGARTRHRRTTVPGDHRPAGRLVAGIRRNLAQPPETAQRALPLEARWQGSERRPATWRGGGGEFGVRWGSGAAGAAE